MEKAIEKALKTIEERGCDRVITTHDGGMVPYENALKEFRIDVEFIFIDINGWTLGAGRNMYGNAANLDYEWIAVLIKPMSKPIYFEQFLKLGDKGVQRILPANYSVSVKIPQPKKTGHWSPKR